MDQWVYWMMEGFDKKLEGWLNFKTLKTLNI